MVHFTHLTPQETTMDAKTFAAMLIHHAEEHGPTTLTHAFLNALLYLDWDRKGFDYPIVPIQVNAYGKDVVRTKASYPILTPIGKTSLSVMNSDHRPLAPLPVSNWASRSLTYLRRPRANS